MGRNWDAEGQIAQRKHLAKFKENCANVLFYAGKSSSEIIDFICLPMVALNWKEQNPIWGQVIGPPGSGKTQHLDFYDGNPKAYFIDRLSSNSLISGFRPEGEEENDPSILPEMNGKLVILKEFTVILQGPKEEREAIIGQLRDIYDGKTSRAFGNIGRKEYRSRFNLALAVTPVIDGFHRANQQLGERFISRREYAVSRNQITAASFDNIFGGGFKSKMAILRSEFNELMEDTPTPPIDGVMWPPEMRHRLITMCDFVARARSHVMRERGGKHISSRPVPEVGSRLITQLAQVGAAFAVLNGYPEINEHCWDFLCRIMRDTLPACVCWVLYHCFELASGCGADRSSKNAITAWTPRHLLESTKLGYDTVDNVLTDMQFNGILISEYSKGGQRGTAYTMSRGMFDTFKDMRFFKDYDENEIDSETLKERTKPKERG